MQEPTPSQQTARYELLVCLGTGAAGEVYHARDLEKNREVVIKVLRQHSSEDPTQVERFKNEFSSLKVCYHRNIVKVYDFHEVSNASKWFSSQTLDTTNISARYFFTMEYIEGAPLKDIIYSDSRPSFEDSIYKLYQVARGLYYIHERKLIHRDLKPDNIFISSTNEAKLLDFGIAKFEDSDLNLTLNTGAMGTSYYMSPEQINNDKIDYRTDIYAFGILVFEMLTGERPFADESRMQLYLKHLAADMPSACEKNSELPEWVDILISTCTQKDREDRYQSMADIISLLQARCEFLSGFEEGSELGEEQTQIQDESWKEAEKRIARKAIKKRASFTGKQAFFMFVLAFTFLITWISPIGHWSTAQVLRGLFYLRGPIEPPGNVQIVALDDLSFNKLGLSTQQPIPRKLWAKLLTQIHSTKPKIVIIDGYFSKVNYEYLPGDKFNEEADLALEKAIKLGPTTLARWEEENTSIPKSQRTKENMIIHGSDPRFSQHAYMELPMSGNVMGGYISYLGLDIYKELSQNDRFPMINVLKGVGIDGLNYPERYDLINYYGPPGTISNISMFKVFETAQSFEDKIVLIGYQSKYPSSGPGSFDVFSTSGSREEYYGVEVHATILGNYIDKSHIKRLPEQVETGVMSGVCGLVFAIILVLVPIRAVRLFLLTLVTWLGVTVVSFFVFNLYFPGALMFALFGFPACGIGWFFYARAAETDLRQAERMTNLEFRKHSRWNK